MVADEAYQCILGAMRNRGRVLVAFSGGVDSALVAKLAWEALGEDAAAVITDTETLPRRDLEHAVSIAREIGLPLRILAASELRLPEYAANPPDRCYLCRRGLGSVLLPLAREEGFTAIADGIHRSDLGDTRPGLRAMDEAGFWHPLLEAGLDKPGVRVLAREVGLSCWDRPSNACLSSRIPHGELITEEKLRRVELAESFLFGLGFRQVRVRHASGAARVEVNRQEVPRLLREDTALAVRTRLRELGFGEIVLDPNGYRAGAA